MRHRRCQGTNDAIFPRILDFLPRHGAAAVLEAYFDESERASGMFCVAGYAFAPHQARKFAKEWRRLFPNGFHMVEFAHRNGIFEGIEADERDDLFARAVETISERASVAVAVSCNVAEVNRHAIKGAAGYEHAYPLCCHLCMMGLCRYLDKAGSHAESIAYIFEAGNAFENEARRFMLNVSKNDDLKTAYKHHSDSFVLKGDAVALESADLLAWEWGKFKDETLDRALRPMRRSFREMLRKWPGRYKMHHVEEKHLSVYMEQIRGLGLTG